MHQSSATPFLIVALLTIGCSPAPPVVSEYDLINRAGDNWMMSPDEAVLTATEYCVAEGINLSAHSKPQVSCDTLDGARLWSISYDGFSRTYGDHFMLLINDETESVEYVSGE